MGYVRTVLRSACMLIMLTAVASQGRDIYVDNLNGSDASSGAKDAPYKSAYAAVAALKPSDSLHLIPTGVPYFCERSIDIRNIKSSPDHPLVIDGHGSTITGFGVCGIERWKDEGDGVFSMPFRNNALMRSHWEGFDLVFFDGKPGKSCESRKSLEPYGYVLFTSRITETARADTPLNTLYIRLPQGKTPADIRIGTIASNNDGNIAFTGVSHVLVRNLISTWSRSDGFDTCFASNITFENVEAHHNMDQGISSHSSDVLVKNSWFHENAGCGIVDVRLNKDNPLKTKYVGCLIENDTFRGGIEIIDGECELVDCIVRGNPKTSVKITSGPFHIPSRLKASNCVFIGGSKSNVGIGAFESTAVLDNCTFSNFGSGISFSALKPGKELQCAVSRCAFIKCMSIFAGNGLENNSGFRSDNNYFQSYGGAIALFSKPYQDYQKSTGQDLNSIFDSSGKMVGENPYSLPGLKGKADDGGDIGASLSPSPKVGTDAKQ